MKIETNGAVEYYFERRRYGATGTMRMFTWLMWRKVGTKEWKSYGDPWPKVRLSKADLFIALDNIRKIVEAVDPATKALIDAEVFGEFDNG